MVTVTTKAQIGSEMDHKIEHVIVAMADFIDYHPSIEMEDSFHAL